METDELILTLKMNGFVEYSAYTVRGLTAECVSKSLGSSVFKTGSKARMYGAHFERDKLIDFIPYWLLVYRNSDVITMSIFKWQWDDNDELKEVEIVETFDSVTDLFERYLSLQRECLLRSIQAIQDLEKAID